MKQLTILAVLAALTIFGFAQQASAQTVPNVRGIQAFSMQAQYMSLTGYLRWQYSQENHVWISCQEAEALVKAQVNTTQ